MPPSLSPWVLFGVCPSSSGPSDMDSSDSPGEILAHILKSPRPRGCLHLFRPDHQPCRPHPAPSSISAQLWALHPQVRPGAPPSTCKLPVSPAQTLSDKSRGGWRTKILPQSPPFPPSEGQRAGSDSKLPLHSPCRGGGWRGPAWIIHSPCVTYGEAGGDTQMWPDPCPETLWGLGPRQLGRMDS